MLLKMIRLDSLFLSTIRRKLWLVAQKLRASNKDIPSLASHTYRSFKKQRSIKIAAVIV